MPIIVKDYTWTQTINMVHIRIPLSQGYREDVDLFTTDSYIKAHFSPFLFEVFLLNDIDSEKSRGIVKSDLIVLDLVKREKLEWERLEKELTKMEKMKIKEEVLDGCRKKAQKEAEDKRVKKSELDRFTVQQAMEIDTRQHALMESRRDEERNKAMNALEEWRANTSKDTPKGQSEVASGLTITELPPSDDESVDKPTKTDNKMPVKITKPKVPVPRGPVKTPVKSEYVDKKKEEMAKRVLPKLRETAGIVVTHTPRTFPTPSRESSADEEQAWLKNITLARRATGFVSEDLRPEEQDPQWCKEKGDQFFRNGNYLGAVSAYSHGIKLSDTLPSLFANRAATHFALGNFNKCVNDCSSALDLMKPPCEGNRRSRAKCIARRAAALARLGFLNKAIGEMKAASKLLPDDEKIKEDVYDMERAWEQDPDSD